MTRLRGVAGKVLVAGSHAGVIAAWYGAKAGVERGMTVQEFAAAVTSGR